MRYKIKKTSGTFKFIGLFVLTLMGSCSDSSSFSGASHSSSSHLGLSGGLQAGLNYICPNAFNVSNANFIDTLPVRTEETIPRGLAFNHDGTKVYVIGSNGDDVNEYDLSCLLYTSPSPRDATLSRMPSSA